ncbi:hypothetical protein HHK36_005963 [Tetracentron sinense]|uniref:Nodulation signaling pathway 1-like protein n=1 Tax=Tetracentron sinense TaxID=13715 RepID=A0A834ZHR6_TETSI|nr:hypothetical protein HHK36_005963 [Tetracentron sinense]
MAIEEPESDSNPTSDHVLDWLEDSVSFLPSFLDDPYNGGDVNGYQWWDQEQDLINNTTTSLNSTTATTPPTITDHPLASDSSKKRKSPSNPTPQTPQNHHDQRRRINGKEDAVLEEEVVTVRRHVGSKKPTAKSTGNNCNNGINKEGRWAEQLLNPCAAAISSGHLTRVQHLLFVLNELASPSGDANHRLTSHGLRSLTHHLSSTSSVPMEPTTFASTEPRFFQRSLLKFYEVSPWFAFPNNIANASILQILAQEPDRSRNLHILDIGVSHGMQWPTLLEALTRRSGGPPPLVRLTIVAATAENNQNTATPFSVGPPGDDFSSRLLRFAKAIDLNLQINRLNNQPLQTLTSQIISTSPDETLIVCAQFRLHNLSHTAPDDRTEFLKVVRNFEPKAVILSENNMECSCSHCGDFAIGFSRLVEYLWRFLDSTSSAFKGRECEERRVVEGEAATALTSQSEMNEGKEKWCERMRGVGFVGEVLGEEATDGARALLRKYDSNWEMRMDEKDGCVCLWWKGQPVSFCSLWKSE